MQRIVVDQAVNIDLFTEIFIGSRIGQTVGCGICDECAVFQQSIGRTVCQLVFGKYGQILSGDTIGRLEIVFIDRFCQIIVSVKCAIQENTAWEEGDSLYILLCQKRIEQILFICSVKKEQSVMFYTCLLYTSPSPRD